MAPPALNFEDELPESLIVIGLLLAVAATSFIFLCRFKKAGDVVPKPAAQTSGGQTAEECSGQATRGSVDTTALEGLRGLAALHVAGGHYAASFLGVDLAPVASMSLFYLLSGFVVTLGYAKPAETASGSASDSFSTKRFLRNRFARLYPSYLLFNTLGLVTMLAHGVIQPGSPGSPSPRNLMVSFAMAVFGVNVWLYPLNAWIADPLTSLLLPPDGVSWTIQTMAPFYLFFPVLLPWLRSVRNARSAIVGLYWLQLVIFIAVYMTGVAVVENFWWGFWVARSWPLGRLPIFAMGCLMALERTRSDGADRSTCWGLWCCSGDCSPSQLAWGRRATAATAAFIAVSVCPFAVQITMSMGKGCALASAPVEGWMVFADGFIEAFIPLLFVDLIGSLTRCGDHGLVAQFCRTRLMQFLGKVSMAFYLSHWVVLAVAKDLVASDNPLVPLPLPLAPVCFLCSLAVASLSERYFETPIRRLLQG